MEIGEIVVHLMVVLAGVTVMCNMCFSKHLYQGDLCHMSHRWF